MQSLFRDPLLAWPGDIDDALVKNHSSADHKIQKGGNFPMGFIEILATIIFLATITVVITGWFDSVIAALIGSLRWSASVS